MSKPVVIDVDASRPIAEQIDTPENRAAVEDVIRNVLGVDEGEAPAQEGSLWGEPEQAQVPPIAFTTERKAIHQALVRTQHAQESDEDGRPVLQAWWLSVAAQKLVIHAADNRRVARATVDCIPAPEDAEGVFGIHRSDAKKLLAFLATGPDDVWVTAEGGGWSFSHGEGRLTGRLMVGTPPDWSAVTTGYQPAVVVALNSRFVAEAGKAAEGRSGVVRVEYIAEDKPVIFRSSDLDEWVMPVRIGTPEP